MKMKIAISVLLLFPLVLVACITINVPPTATKTEPPSTPTVTYTPTPTPTPTVTVTVTPTPTPTPTVTMIPPTVTATVPATLIPLYPFENQTWQLDAYGTTSILQAPIPGKTLTIKFDSSTGKVGGSSGCNTYNGSYIKSGNLLNVSGVMSTMMYCTIPSGIMSQEQKYLDALKAAQSYEVGSAKLIINCSPNRVLVFKPY